MRALFAMLVVLPAVALADWHSGPVVPGVTPLDVQAYDGGLFTVTIGGNGTSNGNAFAYRWADGGASYVDGVDGGDFVGAALQSPSCVLALEAGGALNAKLFAFKGPGCGGGTLGSFQTATGFYAGERFRASQLGMLIATFNDGSSQYVNVSINGGAFQNRSNPLGVPVHFGLAAAPWNGADHFVFSTFTNLQSNQFDGGTVTAPVTAPSADPRDLSLFDNGPTLGGFGVDSAGTAVWYASDVRGAGFVQLFTGTGFSAIDYTQLNGSPNGLGFGVLGEGSTILGPLPNPGAPGQLWVQRSAPPGLVPPVIHVSCADPSFCVLLDSAKNVFVYTNDAPPSFGAVGPLVVVPPNQNNNLLPVNVTDPDGDPVWLTADGGTLANFALLFDGGTSASVQFASGTGCRNPGSPIDLVASDGWRAHDMPLSFTVAWDQVAPQSPPPLYLRAGGAPATASITPVCGESYTFFPDDGGLTVTGPNQNQVTGPANACSEQPLIIYAETQAIDGGQLVYPVSVFLEPWGPPLDPVFAMNNVSQAAGSTVPYDTGPEHVCDAGTIGTLISVVNPFGSTVTVDAGPNSITVSSSDPCTDSAGGGGALTMTYQRSVLSPAVGTLPAETQFSDAGTLIVSFTPDAGPLGTGVTYSFSVFDAGDGLVTGDAGPVADATCSSQRDYRNDVTITQGSSIVADGGFPLGGWALAISGSCSGDFLVSSTLTDLRFGGTVSAPSSIPVTLTASQKAEVDGLAGTVTVSCTGGSGAVTAQIDGGCPGQLLNWQALGSFDLATDGGLTATLSGFPANQLDALTGTVANVEIVIPDGTPNPTDRKRPVLLVPDHFITLERNPNPVIPNEEEPSAIALDLHNTSNCDVSGVGIREDLLGLTLVKDSVRVNGRKADGVVASGRLLIDGLAIPAGGTAHVSYLARVPLLSQANPSGKVVMVRPVADSSVSCDLTPGGQCQFDVTAPPGPSGSTRSCGCGAIPDASVLLLTLAAVFLRRRSR